MPFIPTHILLFHELANKPSYEIILAHHHENFAATTTLTKHSSLGYIAFTEK